MIFTVAEAVQLRGRLPGGHCESLFLKDKKGGLWLVVALEECPVDLKWLADRLAAPRFSFGNAELLYQVLGVRPVREASEKGVNAAVERGMRETPDSEGWLILPADIPFLTNRDLSKVLSSCESGAAIVISPSREFNGTNLLLLERGARLKLSYDMNSFSSHLAAAARSGFSVSVYCSWTVTLDIDSVEDVRLALSKGVRNATTTFLKSKLP